MKKVLFLIAQQNFRDEELKIPKKILEENELKVTITSITTEEARGMLGFRIKPTLMVREVNVNYYDGLVVIGGAGSPKLVDYPEVLNLIKRFNEQKKPIAAICLAGYVLAKAGILKGRNATVFPSDFALAEYRRHGVKYSDESIVVDGNIITAVGPEVAEEFGKQIVKILA